MLELKKVTKRDYNFLYEILRLRLSEPNINISHTELPTLEQHCNFCDNCPYKSYWIIYYCNKKVGCAYVTKNNEVGIYLLLNYRNKGLGKLVLKIIGTEYSNQKLYANINPDNLTSQEFFINNGYKLIQKTYVKAL